MHTLSRLSIVCSFFGCLFMVMPKASAQSTSAPQAGVPQSGVPQSGVPPKKESPKPVPVRVVESSSTMLALRLLPGMDLKEELDRIVSERGIKAAAVLTCVGSLRDAVIRFANKPNGTGLRGPLEIVSLTGTLGSESGSHLHIALSDGEGRTIGGHLMAGCHVFTTAEIVLAVLTDAVFTREMDSESSYKELFIKPVQKR